MRYLKNYNGFMFESEDAGSQKVVVTADTAKNLDAKARQAGVDLEDEETLAALLQDYTNQLDKNLNNPKPKIVLDLGTQSVKERVEWMRNSKAFEGHGASAEHSILETLIHAVEYFFTTGEVAETSAHNVLGHLGHDHHGGEKHIEETKDYIKKNGSKIKDYIKGFIKVLKGASNTIYKLTLGLLDRLIIWVCRNIFKTKVSTAAKSGGYVLAAIALGLFFYTGIHALPTIASAMNAGTVTKTFFGFIPFIAGAGTKVVHLMHSAFGIFRSVKSTAGLGKGKEVTSLLEFGDVVEDALKEASTGEYDINGLRQEMYKKTDKGFVAVGKEFVRTNHIIKLKAIQSHLNDEAIRWFSEHLTKIFSDKNWKELEKVPYFNQCLKKYEGQKVSGKDLSKGFWGVGHSKFEEWLEEEFGKDIYNKQEEFTNKHIKPVLKDLEDRGIKPTFLTNQGGIDEEKIQKNAEFFETMMKGIGNKFGKFRESDLKSYFQNEADWKLTFFAFDVRNGRNLISTFYYELPEKGSFNEISVEMIKNYLKEIGCKNVDSEFEYFSSKEGKDKIVKDVDE